MQHAKGTVHPWDSAVPEQGVSPPSMRGLWSGPSTTLKGQCFMSCCTAGSVNLRPIRRFTSNTVLRGFSAT